MQTSVPSHSTSSGRVSTALLPAVNHPPPHTWVGRSAEELLHKHARKPGRAGADAVHVFQELHKIHKRGNVQMDLNTGAVSLLKEAKFETVREGHDPSTTDFLDPAQAESVLNDVAALIKLLDAPIVVEARCKAAPSSNGRVEQAIADHHLQKVKEQLFALCVDYNNLRAMSSITEDGPEISFRFDSCLDPMNESGENWRKRSGPLPAAGEHLVDILMDVLDAHSGGNLLVDLNTGHLELAERIKFAPIRMGQDPRQPELQNEEDILPALEDVAQLAMNLCAPVEVHGHTVAPRRSESKDFSLTTGRGDTASWAHSAAENRAKKIHDGLLGFGMEPHKIKFVVDVDGEEATHDGYWRTPDGRILRISSGCLYHRGVQRAKVVCDQPGTIALSFDGQERMADLRDSNQCLLFLDCNVGWTRELVTLHIDLLQCRHCDAASLLPPGSAQSGVRPHASRSMKGSKTSLKASKSLALTSGSSASKSSSAPVLKPLGPPTVTHTAFPEVERLHKEPPEFEIQRVMEAGRHARKLLRATYRSCIEGLGCQFFTPDPWPPKDPPPPPDAGKVDPELTREAYFPAPFPLKDKPPKLAAPPSLAARSPQTPTDLSLRGPMSSTRRDALRKLKEFGRGGAGSPWTFGQVFSEIDADVHHRKPRDTRAIVGKLGPLQLGPSATRARRPMPFTMSAIGSASLPDLHGSRTPKKSLGN